MSPSKQSAILSVVLFMFLIIECKGKLSENDAPVSPKVEKEPEKSVPEFKAPRKMSNGAALLFADELKMTLERYLFGICPQTFKMQLGRAKNATVSCDLDTEQHDLAGRFATLALRAHSAARSDCSQLAAALVNALGDLARTAESRQAVNAAAAATAEANKKRKLSKSQKAKLQAKQRTALAVKKKAAAMAAAQAAKMAGAAS